MRIILMLLLTLPSLAMAKPKDRSVKLSKGTVVLPGAWFACAEDNDCGTAVGPKGCWKTTILPINKKFIDAAIKKMTPMCDGESPEGVIGGAGPVCRAEECSDH